MYQVMTSNIAWTDGKVTLPAPVMAVSPQVVPDYQWALAYNGQRVTKSEDITPDVCSQIRKAIEKHKAKAPQPTSPAPPQLVAGADGQLRLA